MQKTKAQKRLMSNYKKKNNRLKLKKTKKRNKHKN